MRYLIVISVNRCAGQGCDDTTSATPSRIEICKTLHTKWWQRWPRAREEGGQESGVGRRGEQKRAHNMLLIVVRKRAAREMSDSCSLAAYVTPTSRCSSREPAWIRSVCPWCVSGGERGPGRARRGGVVRHDNVVQCHGPRTRRPYPYRP